jgi:hypothetical protein
MFGLEKKQKGLFEFDLEKDLKSNPTKAKALLKTVEEKVHTLKNSLRQGAGSADFDTLNKLLLGYTALQRVLTKITSNK